MSMTCVTDLIFWCTDIRPPRSRQFSLAAYVHQHVIELETPIRELDPVDVPAARRQVDLPAACAWVLAFVLVTYLSLRGGGYDLVVRSEVGVALWWLILLCALGGILVPRIGSVGWLAIALLSGFALWTGLAIGWSESAEQSVTELGRIAAYLGVLVTAIALQGRVAARHTLNGLTCAIAVITVLAVLSRLIPGAFPPDQHFQFLGPESARKLSYPLNYWNGLADFAAMGIPLLLGAAVGARTLAGRALAAATLPLSVVCIYLTISRGGVVAAGVGIAVFLLLIPRRIEGTATLVVSGIASAMLLLAVSHSSGVTNGLRTQTAERQGAELLALTIVVCGVVAALQVAITRAQGRLQRPGGLAPDRRTTARRALVLAVAALVIAVAAGVPGKLAHAWHDFKQPNGVVTAGSESSVISRLSAANGNSRYQFWQSALHANATHPWRGIGPGTFQFWWARHATADGFIRNAHSLYFETLAETGIIGFALLGGLLALFAVVAVRRSLRDPPAVRLWLAGAAGSLAVFLFGAAVEWIWQLAAIAATALVLGAVIVAGRDEQPEDSAPAERATGTRARRLVTQAVLAVLALASLGAVLVPLGGHLAIRNSESALARGDLSSALADSRSAERLQPYAASAHLQEALVLEAGGALAPAAAAARVATTDEPTDWTMWLTLARIDARRGATVAALAELRRARELNPRSTVFHRQ